MSDLPSLSDYTSDELYLELSRREVNQEALRIRNTVWNGTIRPEDIIWYYGEYMGDTLFAPHVTGPYFKNGPVFVYNVEYASEILHAFCPPGFFESEECIYGFDGTSEDALKLINECGMRHKENREFFFNL